MSSSSTRGWGSRVLLLVSVLLVLAFFVDCVLMNSRYNENRRLLGDVRHFPDFDYQPVAGDPEFNPDGIRDARTADEFEEDDCNIVFLGDSFVFGMRVWPSEALPQQLELWTSALHPTEHVRVANFGWISASPYLAKDVLAELGPGYKPDLVLLAVDVTDPHEDIKYRHYTEQDGVHSVLSILPSFLLMAKELAAVAGLHEAWFGYPWDRLFPVNLPVEEMRPHMAQMRANIDTIASHVQGELGARFALLVVPRHYHYSGRESPKDWEAGAYDRRGKNRYSFFTYFDEMADEVDYPVRSLLPVLRQVPFFPTTFYRDPHWNPPTHHFVARQVLRILQEEGLLCSAAPSPEPVSPPSQE